jgi:Protein of unknown function (DUF2849)
MAAEKIIRQALTANRLRDGIAVFLSEYGTWSPWLHDAQVARSKDDAGKLEARGAQDTKMNIVVGVYLIDVIEEDGALRAAHIREHMRTQGPSVRTDLGKQAEAADAQAQAGGI